MRDFSIDLLNLTNQARTGDFMYHPALIYILRTGLNCTDPRLQEDLITSLEACIASHTNLSNVLWHISQQTIAMASPSMSVASPSMTSEAAVEADIPTKETADAAVGTDGTTFTPIGARARTPTGGKKKKGILVHINGKTMEMKSPELIERYEEAPIAEKQEEAPIAEKQEEAPIAEKQEEAPIAERHNTLANTPPATPKQTSVTVQQLFEASKLSSTSSWAKVASKPPVVVKQQPVDQAIVDTQIKLSEIFKSYYDDSMKTHNNVLIALSKAFEAAIRYHAGNKISDDTVVNDMTDVIKNSPNKIVIDSVVGRNLVAGEYIKKEDFIYRRQIERNQENYHQEISFTTMNAIVDHLEDNPDDIYDEMTPIYNQKGKEIVNNKGLSAAKKLMETFKSARIEKKTIKDMLVDDVIAPFVKYFNI